MDDPVGQMGRQDTVAVPDGFGQDLLRRIAQLQGHTHRLQHGGIGKSRRKGIHRQHPAGGDRRGIQGFKDRIGHTVAGIVTRERTVENKLAAKVKETATIKVKEVTMDEFRKLVEKN